MNTLKTMIVSALAVLTISFTALTASASDASAGGWKKGYGYKHHYGYNYGYKYKHGYGYYGHKYHNGYYKFKKFKKGRKFRNNFKRKFR